MQKVKPGDPLRIPAATFNTMIDAAADYRRRAQSGGRPRGRDARPSDLVQVKNYTGQDCPRFGVMDAAHVVPSHGHPVQTTTINSAPGSTPQQVVTAVNAATGQTLTHNDVDARPRRYGVKFYVRIDNSAAE